MELYGSINMCVACVVVEEVFNRKTSTHITRFSGSPTMQVFRLFIFVYFSVVFAQTWNCPPLPSHQVTINVVL